MITILGFLVDNVLLSRVENINMGFAFMHPYVKWINSFTFAEKNKIQLGTSGTLTR